MIAETIGGTDHLQTAEMYRRFEKSRKEKPRCISCRAKLAFDRANEKQPVCHPCEKRLLATGETPTQLINRQRGIAAARTRNSGGHKLPNLRKIRESRAISKTALAERAGLHHHTISNIELRGSMAAPKTIAGLTKALEVSELELRGEQ